METPIRDSPLTVTPLLKTCYLLAVYHSRETRKIRSSEVQKVAPWFPMALRNENPEDQMLRSSEVEKNRKSTKYIVSRSRLYL
jgi:hypothetical protein